MREDVIAPRFSRNSINFANLRRRKNKFYLSYRKDRLKIVRILRVTSINGEQSSTVFANLIGRTSTRQLQKAKLAHAICRASEVPYERKSANAFGDKDARSTDETFSLAHNSRLLTIKATASITSRDRNSALNFDRRRSFSYLTLPSLRIRPRSKQRDSS